MKLFYISFSYSGDLVYHHYHLIFCPKIQCLVIFFPYFFICHFFGVLVHSICGHNSIFVLIIVLNFSEILKHCIINIADVYSCFIILMQTFINEIKSFHFIAIAFTSSPLKLFKCQIIYLALLLTLICKLAKEKIVPLKTNAFITVPPIVNNNGAIFYRL